MGVDLVLKGGEIVTPNGVFKGGIAVQGGRITAITSSSSLPTASRVIDCDGLHVLPGIIDAHVHFMDPGRPEREDFTTGTTAAAAGGITLVMDMPMTTPAVTDATIFKAKRRMLEEKSLVDFCLLAMASNTNLDGLQDLKEAGAASFEIFPANFWPSTTLPEELILTSDLAAVHALHRIGDINGVAGVLPDAEVLRVRLIEELMAADRTDLHAWSESKPDFYEVSALAKFLGYLRFTETKAVLRQLTTAASMEVVEALWRDGIYVEVDVQNLTLTEDRLDEIGPYAKTNPPLKTAMDVATLWRALQAGWVDFVASDHGPCLPEDKERGRTNVWECPSGMLGVETLLPLMLDRVNQGTLSLEHLAALLAENPARIHGLFPRKGTIRPGSDADLTVVDVNRVEVIRGENLHSRLKWTPYEGMRVEGWPVHTIVRGEPVMVDRDVIGATGHGTFIPSDAPSRVG